MSESKTSAKPKAKRRGGRRRTLAPPPSPSLRRYDDDDLLSITQLAALMNITPGRVRTLRSTAPWRLPTPIEGSGHPRWRVGAYRQWLHEREREERVRLKGLREHAGEAADPSSSHG